MFPFDWYMWLVIWALVFLGGLLFSRVVYVGVRAAYRRYRYRRDLARMAAEREWWGKK